MDSRIDKYSAERLSSDDDTLLSRVGPILIMLIIIFGVTAICLQIRPRRQPVMVRVYDFHPQQSAVESKPVTGEISAPTHYSVDDYVTRFKTFAAQYNELANIDEKLLDSEASNMRLTFGDSLAVDSHVVGQCAHEERVIRFKQSFWDSASDLTREQLVFHELGHCVLGREHANGEVQVTMSDFYPSAAGAFGSDFTETDVEQLRYANRTFSIPVSIMYPALLPDQVYKVRHQEYLRELFFGDPEARKKQLQPDPPSITPQVTFVSTDEEADNDN